jgi:RNA polymerase sigma-70 factor (ECF subfamily)
MLVSEDWRHWPISQLQTTEEESQLVEALRAGDERAFTRLVERYHLGLIHFAQQYVPDRSVAEGVVQEAWLGVLRGLDRFEARSSLKTWIFGIVLNCARARARRDRRTIPFSEIERLTAEPFEPAVEPSRFRGAADPHPGGWISFPPSWGDTPDQRLLAAEAHAYVRAAIDSLPASQRQVVLLRDVEGCSADEACSILQLSESNQRVLLHRGRSKLRRAIERYLTEQ